MNVSLKILAAFNIMPFSAPSLRYRIEKQHNENYVVLEKIRLELRRILTLAPFSTSLLYSAGLCGLATVLLSVIAKCRFTCTLKIA